MATMNMQPENISTELKPGLDKPANNWIYGVSAASIVLSLLTARRNLPLANFFGLWAPTILGIGIFMKGNKLLETNRRQPAM